ncbi:hypothetical protein [Agrococcus sp. ProA11]|uniref:hypothetical protein n=1 Tax=Agrococcus chionoecetis TaxID=3153752 RepID=UPI003260EA5A
MPLRTRLSRVTAALIAVPFTAALLLSACTLADSEPPEQSIVRTTDPDAALTVVAEQGEGAASLAVSRALFDASPLVIIAATGDAGGQELSARAAIDLGVPVLVAPTGDPVGAASAGPAPASTGADDAEGAARAVSAELERLGASSALVVGAVAALAEEDGGASIAVERVDATADAIGEASGIALGDPTAADPSGFAAGVAAYGDDSMGSTGDADTQAQESGSLSRPESAAPLTDTIALAVDSVDRIAPIATARAAGVPVHLMPEGITNPQATPSAIDALHASAASRTLAIGAAFDAEPALDWKVRAARSGFQLPGGGQLVFDQHQFVALYGTPSTSVLGVLGEQDVAGSVQRAREIAAPYQALTDRTVVPMFEIIATVAAGQAGPDGNYSNELSVESLRPLIDAAAEAGIYVVIDLQPGRTDFLTQAKQYEALLALPNVGLALDPEWRLEPDEVHMRQIGSVSAAEVNSVVTWLADLTNERGLPQKMFVLHQFRLDMITDRDTLDVSRPELALLIHVDGLGSQPAKQATWEALMRDAPAGLHWGWKNFYDEDLPMLTPEQTMRDVSPVPDLVTYQ